MDGDEQGERGWPELARNLNHLRLFLRVCAAGSATGASRAAHLSQPAVTQALAGLERAAGGPLFERRPGGMAVTARGAILSRRLGRAFAGLDPALSALAPRLVRTATAAQLRALVAVVEAGSITLAARREGLAQSTMHRTIARLEGEAGRPVFERGPAGARPRRATEALARAVGLALHEIAQARAELAEHDGGSAGQIVVGALPLSRSALLPEALAAFCRARPAQGCRVVDGPFETLLADLRRGAVDVIVGALRDPSPGAGVVQERLFGDRLTVIARPGHPLAGTAPGLAELARRRWVVPRTGTPARAQFDALFAGHAVPGGIVEAGSVLFMREFLRSGDHLGCISGLQARAELENGLLVRIGTPADWPERPIGLIHRRDWAPTAAQAELLDHLRAAGAALDARGRAG